MLAVLALVDSTEGSLAKLLDDPPLADLLVQSQLDELSHDSSGK